MYNQKRLTTVSAVVPVLPGVSVRVTKEGIQAGIKAGGKSVKKAVFKTDKTSDVGKELKEKGVTKFKSAVKSADKKVSNEISGARPNRRPDIMGIRNNGLIDQVEVPSKTDIPDLLIDRMIDNQRIMGDRAGSIKVKDINGGA